MIDHGTKMHFIRATEAKKVHLSAAKIFVCEKVFLVEKRMLLSASSKMMWRASSNGLGQGRLWFSDHSFFLVVHKIQHVFNGP